MRTQIEVVLQSLLFEYLFWVQLHFRTLVFLHPAPGNARHRPLAGSNDPTTSPGKMDLDTRRA
jgi:hypothetical protein